MHTEFYSENLNGREVHWTCFNWDDVSKADFRDYAASELHSTRPVQGRVKVFSARVVVFYIQFLPIEFDLLKNFSP